LVKKLREMEVSWALGAGFHLLNTYHESNFSQNSSSVKTMYLTSTPRRSFLSTVLDIHEHHSEQGRHGCDEPYQKWLLEYLRERMEVLIGYLKSLSV